jgi:hypothetical protein
MLCLKILGLNSNVVEELAEDAVVSIHKSELCKE